jgi:hypothetical protein
MKVRPLSRALVRSTFLLACLALTGCPNPTVIGLQDYGSIFGNVVSSTGSPIQGAIVSATGSTQPVTTDNRGYFLLQNVAVGQQTVTASAAGYASGSASVIVPKNDQVNAGNIALAQTTSTPISH